MIVGIYGCSGFGREVLPLVRAQIEKDGEIYFIDDDCPVEKINGIEVVSWDYFLAVTGNDKRVCIAIGSSQVREKLQRKCDEAGIRQMHVCAENTVVMDEVIIGDGSILCPFVTVTSNVKIGRSFHANIYSYVAHDCVIGDFVTLAPSVKCNGNVVIEDNAYIGTGAIIKQGTPESPTVIGAGSMVGMGAVVTKSVEPGAVVVGNPAKPIRKISS